MFTFFNENIYLGTSVSELSEIRTLLEQNGIKYKYHLQNHEGQWLVLGRNTIRGNFGSAGMNMDTTNLYEISVSKKILSMPNT